MKKVIYLIDQPLDERNYERFGIQAWLERNWAVEAWDLTPWAHPAVWKRFIEFGSQFKIFPGYFPIASRRELTDRLLSAGKIDYFIDLTSDNYHSFRAKLSLKRTSAVRIVCAGGSIPIPDRRPVGLVGKLAKLAAKGPNGSLKWISSALFQRVVARRVASGLAIVSGEQSLAACSGCPVIIRTHNFDYDVYLALSKSARTVAARYAVFIDQDYCFHPEWEYQGIPPVATPERYFPAIRNGLKVISDALKLEIRIAAHPRATYRKRALQCYGGFAMEFGRTAELIKDCDAVVCHDSTAIQFAVLFGKPAIFVTTDELAISYEGGSIIKMAAELGKSPINLDSSELHAVDWAAEMKLDAGKYADYRRKYIKTEGSPEIPLWDIVIDHLANADA